MQGRVPAGPCQIQREVRALFQTSTSAIRAAIDGIGLAFSFEEHVAAQLDTGVLYDSCLQFPGFFLYLSESAAAAGGLSALIETLRL